MIPRHWTIERLTRELRREQDYADRYSVSDPLVSRQYAKRADDLREAIAAKKRAIGILMPGTHPPVPWP